MSALPPKSDPRRSFLGRLAGSAMAMAALPFAARRAEAEVLAPFADEPWLAAVSKARHKQLFDAPGINSGFPMMFAGAYLMTMKGAYSLKPGEAHAMIVVRHAAAVLAVNDTIWSKYKLGEAGSITDAQTKAPAVRNPYYNSKPGDMPNTDFSIDKLPALGVTIVACNLALTKYAERTGGAIGMKADEALAEWKANLLPGVFVAPSGVLAVGRAQEAGCTYCYAS
jgi:intracellular sulfur oxidation DsrE/DsrF family protein